MKNILALLILCTTALFAQVPQGFNYQAALRDAAGAVLSSQPVSVKIELSQGSVTYTEIHNLTTNAVGLINITVGYTPQAGGVAFSDIDWNAGGVSMTTSYDPAGGANWTLVGTSILQSVPYALSAANGFSGDFNDLTNVPSIDTSSVNELQSLSVNGDTIKLSQGGSVYFQRFSGVFSDLTGVPSLDTSNTNEIQNLSRNGDTLRLSNGGMVILPLAVKAEKINDLSDGFTSGTSLGLGTGALLNTALTGINNTAVGQNNLSSNTVGSNNTAVGSEALKQNASGSQNTAIGQQAMNSNVNGNSNTALGAQALKSNTSGSSNVALGHDALSLNLTGNENTAVGKNALKQATAGSGNTAIGFESLSENTTGFSNVAIGWKALKSNKSGVQNTAVGRMALMNSKLSTNNTALGEGALHTLEVDSVVSNDNTALGNAALYRLKEGQRNVAIGSGVGAWHEKGSDNIFIGGANQYPTKTLPVWNNVAIGSGSGNHLDSNSYQNILLGGNTGNMLRNGFANTALGFAAMQMMTKGHYNVAVGIQAMQMSNVETSRNTAVGAQALVNVKSNNNTAIGMGSQNQTTTGADNTSVGAYSLNDNTTGYWNTSMGVNSLANNTTGYRNNAIGYQALFQNTTGGFNIAIGDNAMASNISGNHNTSVGGSSLNANTTGNQNVALGWQALAFNTVASGNVAVGYQAMHDNLNGAYNVALGYWSLKSNDSGSYNSAMGYKALELNKKGDRNTAFGAFALNAMTTGSANNAFGSHSLSFVQSGLYNNAFGERALNTSTSSRNSAFGHNALRYNSTGGFNTAVGYESLLYTSTGENNTAFGAGSMMDNTTGSFNTAFGAFSSVGAPNLNNSTAIGGQAIVKESNTVQLGNLNITKINTSGRFFGKGGSFSDSTSSGDNAILRLSSNKKGLLLPRMTQVERDAISNPEEGLIVWCLNCGLNGQLSAFDGVSWVNANMPSVSGSLPNVSTDPVSSFGLTSATFGGNVLASGTGSILARGVCYSTSANPNIASSLTQQTTGSGAYNEFVTNLQPNTTYYLRAFATNSLGTSYGNQVVFKTKKVNVVGDTLGGGIIAYILAPGDQGYVMGEQHGLIALPWDYFNTSITWLGGTCNLPNSTSKFIGDGLSNTNAAYAACSTNSNGAIQVAYNLVVNGYADWFVPSSDELLKLMQSNAFSALNMTNAVYYWSSTIWSGSTITCWRRSGNSINSGTFNYSQSYRLRVVRYF